jgi:hypothetical protein
MATAGAPRSGADLRQSLKPCSTLTAGTRNARGDRLQAACNSSEIMRSAGQGGVLKTLLDRKLMPRLAAKRHPTLQTTRSFCCNLVSKTSRSFPRHEFEESPDGVDRGGERGAGGRAGASRGPGRHGGLKPQPSRPGRAEAAAKAKPKQSLRPAETWKIFSRAGSHGAACAQMMREGGHRNGTGRHRARARPTSNRTTSVDGRLLRPKIPFHHPAQAEQHCHHRQRRDAAAVMELLRG